MFDFLTMKFQLTQGSAVREDAQTLAGKKKQENVQIDQQTDRGQ